MSPWDLDVDPRSYHLRQSDVVLTMNSNCKSRKLVKWHNAIIKGKWNYGSRSIIAKEAISVETANIPRIAFSQYLYILLFLGLMKIFKIINYTWKI